MISWHQARDRGVHAAGLEGPVISNSDRKSGSGTPRRLTAR